MEFEANTPIYLQVIRDIKKKIITGELAPGEKLWSARELALLYKINPNTANRIYKEMEAEEICFTKRGLGTYLTEEAKKVEELKQETANELVAQFVQEMTELGYTREELVEIIKKQS